VAISPGIYNFTIRRRSDHTERFDLCDENGNGVDLTGCVVSAQAWLKGRTQKVFDFTVETLNILQGSFRISVSRTVTSTLPNELEYDIRIRNSANISEYYVAGTILVAEGYTA